MNNRFPLRVLIIFSLIAVTWRLTDSHYVKEVSIPQKSKIAKSVLFIGNSYTFGYGSPVRYYRSQTVADLNGKSLGGVPALFKMFAREAGLSFLVSLEALPGKNLDFHIKEKAGVISKSWDYVLLQGYSTLDKSKPGNPKLIINSTQNLVKLLLSKNPKVDIRLVSTWSRADQIYPDSGFWHGKPIGQMSLDIRKCYDSAALVCGPVIRSVIPVGQAWNRAINESVADPNPYDGINAGQIDLWTFDNHHASAFGYYLSALMIFGDITGLDPRSLGKKERAAFELGFSASQVSALQQIAFEELSATKARPALKTFKPKADILE